MHAARQNAAPCRDIGAGVTSMRRAAGDSVQEKRPSFCACLALSGSRPCFLCCAAALKNLTAQASSVSAMALVREPPTLVMEGIACGHSAFPLMRHATTTLAQIEANWLF